MRALDVKTRTVNSGDVIRIRMAAHDAREVIRANVQLIAHAENRIGLNFVPKGHGYGIRPLGILRANQDPLTDQDYELVSLIANAVHEQMIANVPLFAGFKSRFMVDFDPRAPDFDIRFGPTG